MKISIKRKFQYQADARTLKVLPVGVYEVGKDISQYLCDLALKFGKAEVVVEKVVEKVAPENKVVAAPENKKKVARKPGRRRSTRTKPD